MVVAVKNGCAPGSIAGTATVVRHVDLIGHRISNYGLGIEADIHGCCAIGGAVDGGHRSQAGAIDIVTTIIRDKNLVRHRIHGKVIGVDAHVHCLRGVVRAIETL